MTGTAAPSPGFFTDDTGARRWWDGSRWSDAPAPADELERAVATYVGHGYRVVLLTPRRAVVERRQRLRFGINLALVLVTGGFWLLVLAIRLLSWPVDRVTLTVDGDGNLVPEFS